MERDEVIARLRGLGDHAVPAAVAARHLDLLDRVQPGSPCRSRRPLLLVAAAFVVLLAGGGGTWAMTHDPGEEIEILPGAPTPANTNEAPSSPRSTDATDTTTAVTAPDPSEEIPLAPLPAEPCEGPPPFAEGEAEIEDGLGGSRRAEAEAESARRATVCGHEADAGMATDHTQPPSRAPPADGATLDSNAQDSPAASTNPDDPAPFPSTSTPGPTATTAPPTEPSATPPGGVTTGPPPGTPQGPPPEAPQGRPSDVSIPDADDPEDGATESLTAGPIESSP
jgi:hypothetical protein